METINKQLKLPKIKYYTQHLSIVNVFLPIKMTPKEIEVLAAFMSLEGDIAEQRFGTSARKIVMQSMGIKPGGLGNYLDTLGKKGFITPDDTHKFVIKQLLHPDPNLQNYRFQLVRVNE
jgi:hypothetical protein